MNDCIRLCEGKQALHCPNDTTGDCSQACQLQSSVPFCKMELDALISCSANAPMACSSDGKATTQGCSSEGSAYFRCLLGAFDGGLTD